MSTRTLERRTLEHEPVEVRAEGKELVAYGYAYRFNRLSQNLGGFVEMITPGAGKKSIGESDIRALFNHDPNKVLGRNRAGTLTLEEDDQGGAYEIRLPDNTVGRDLATSLEREDITGSSFGFRLVADDWDETDEGFPLRKLEQFSIRDVGPVTFPAYTDADSSLRSLAESRDLDLDTLLEAAANNSLAAHLAGDNRSTASKETDDGPGETHPRRRFKHLAR